MEERLAKYISRGKVFIFSKSYCKYCDEAKSFLSELSIKFASVEVDLSNEFPNELVEYINKNSGIKTFPKIYIGQKCLGGFSDLKKSYDSMKLFDLLKNENISDFKIFNLSKEMINEFCDMNTNRQILSKIPKEAYLFFPKQEDIIEFDVKNLQKTTRRIFEGGQDFKCFEKQKLEDLDNFIENYNKNSRKRKVSKPDYWAEHDTMRFLQASGYNSEKTVQFLIEHFEWRCLNLPPEISVKTMQVLNSGYLYIHGRDHKFRPIIYIKPSIISKYQKQFNFEDWSVATIYLLEYTINNLFLPGQIENWDIICDLKDCSVTSIPNDFKKILGILQNNYRCRLYRMFILNVGTFFNMMWGMLKKIIDSNTEKKIKILKSGNFKEVFEIINESQIEKKYNGTADDIDSYFFPPIFPSENYILNSEKKETILSSEKEYLKKIKENPKLKKSTLIENKNKINNSAAEFTKIPISIKKNDSFLNESKEDSIRFKERNDSAFKSVNKIKIPEEAKELNESKDASKFSKVYHNLEKKKTLKLTNSSNLDPNKKDNESIFTFCKLQKQLSNDNNISEIKSNKIKDTKISSIQPETTEESFRKKRLPQKKITQSISVLNMDKERNRTPEFLKKKENYISNKNEEKFLDFNSKMEIDLSEEEITKSSNNINSNTNSNNKKVLFRKKTKKINEKREEAPDISLKKLTDVCCSDEVKENCIVF